MKKLAIFLIPLIVSIPAFTQDKSSFTKHFSLIKHSGDNKPRVFKMDIISEGIPFSEAKVLEYKKQNWEDLSNLTHKKQENLSSRKTSESLAEGYLRRLAERKKRNRKTWGAVGLVGGGLVTGLGAATIASTDPYGGWESFGQGLAGAMLMATGVAGVLSGALSLALPSGAEREYKDVLRISDQVQRERISHEALSSLASRGKKRRIRDGILIAILSAVYFFSNETEGYETEAYLSAATFGVFAVYEFSRKSAAERAYQNYLKERERRR
jgi:hypothetical protein